MGAPFITRDGDEVRVLSFCLKLGGKQKYYYATDTGDTRTTLNQMSTIHPQTLG